MRGAIPTLLLVLAAAAFFAYGSLKGPSAPATIDPRSIPDLAPGTVDSVSDGDTIHLADGRRVRLVQIDAPELGRDECFAKEAATELERLATLGSTVSPRRDPTLDLHDRFGRVLAYVFSGKVNLNLRLVERGAAAPYFYRGERGRYARDLMAAARRARAEGRGLWGACPGTQLEPNRAVDTNP